jgi:diguanylate cyclase (GGDEF)-like protein
MMGQVMPELAKKNTVMIVDDDVLNIAALTQILGSDYTLYAEKDGARAIEQAKELLPDLILLDIIMPGMDGFEVMSRLKDMYETDDIPIVFITGLSDVITEEKGLALGAADYIYKPFSPAIVKLRVRNQLQIVNQMRLINFLSITDALTGLFNRRYFNTRLNYEWQRALRDKGLLSILMIDIDNFKNYNDTYGHLQGDAVLKTIANIIKRNLLRSNDMLARWGGEELAALLPGTNSFGAYVVAERLRTAVKAHIFPCIRPEDMHVTVSIGINCVTPYEYGCLRHFVDEADRALYRAKKAGKDRVEMAEGLS